MGIFSRRAFTVTLIGFIVTLQSASAQWSTDPFVNNAISTAVSDQVLPVGVSDGAGGAIIAWEDFRGNGINADIYAQRINAAGRVLWTTDGIALCTAGGDQTAPRVVSDGAGGAIVTWMDLRGGTATDIYAQRVNAAGAVQWAANGVAICTAAGVQSSPAMVGDGAGGAIITWGDRRGTNSDIYAQRINAGGTVQWTANGVPVCTADGDQITPVMVSDGADGALIGWIDRRSGTNSDIYAQRVNGAGLVQWTANGVAVSAAANDQIDPAIASDGAGGAVIAWTDLRQDANGDIFAQSINSTGAVQWVKDGASVCTVAGAQTRPAIASDGAGNSFITWSDGRNGAANFDIYAQCVNGAGSGLWAPFGIAVCAASGNQSQPSIVVDGAGGAIIAWIDFRAGASTDIYAQRINAAGAGRWTANGAPVSTAPNFQEGLKIVGDSGGGAIITWWDDRNGLSADIYAQKVDGLGYLGIANPALTRVADVPGDQGGHVSVIWNASSYDRSPQQVVTYYSVWRGINASGTALGFSSKLTPQGMAAGQFNREKAYRTRLVNGIATNWEWVGDFPSHYLPGYSFTAPTTTDSSGRGTPYFKFFVSAQTADPFVFWDSNIDSGYSVDNLPPAPPAGLTGSLAAGAMMLRWRANRENDLAGYEVYRSRVPAFNPDTMAALVKTSDTVYTDVSFPPGVPLYYALRAVDVHGNRSPGSDVFALLAAGVTAAENEGIPKTFDLDQNYPNPFNPATTIRYGLPQRSHVRITVFSTVGQQVAELVNADLDAGYHEVTFNANNLASGAYFYRLQAGSFVATHRLLLLK